MDIDGSQAYTVTAGDMTAADTSALINCIASPYVAQILHPNVWYADNAIVLKSWTVIDDTLDESALLRLQNWYLAGLQQLEVSYMTNSSAEVLTQLIDLATQWITSAANLNTVFV